MKVIMTGIDHTMAGIDLRSELFFSQSRQEKLYTLFKNDSRIKGAVILCTCNRTELYFSLSEQVVINPFEYLCEQCGVDHRKFRGKHRVLEGAEAFEHLAGVASGIKSLVWGEDQIVTQVKKALEYSRENKAADSILEVFFREAITAAKKVKSTVTFSGADKSVAGETLSCLEKNGTGAETPVLVIGSGKTGRLAARLLAEKGYPVSITVRSSHPGLSGVPKGVHTVGYSDRYREMEKAGCVISATSSPHYTVKKESLMNLEKHPKLLIDLAVPRDIEKSAGKLEHITLYDIDMLAGEKRISYYQKQQEETENIIKKYLDKFLSWTERAGKYKSA